MKDTSEAMQKRFEKIVMACSGEERLRMGCSMFDLSKQIVISSIREKAPQIAPLELKKQVFLRFYGQDFNEEQKEKILGNFDEHH